MNSFTLAIYLRLSSEDADLKLSGRPESNSITNQRNLIRNFIERTPEFKDAQTVEFCDDGWSGKNFERPGVSAMLDEVRQGNIQCIIVKDISRFGRDYLTVGDYISRVFPFMGVRFIAINDGFDSIRPMDIDSLETSFKTLLYDLYSRQLSRNVRKAKRFRAQRGYFIAPFAPFGYKKDPADRHHLIIDPPAAEIVRRIFSMATEDLSAKEIAKRLNDESIPTRMLYKRASGCSRTVWPCVNKDNFWLQAEVRLILMDERYIGKNIYGKRERDIVANTHTIRNNRSDWVIVPDTHESIVTQEEFEQAQAAIQYTVIRKSTKPSREKLKSKIRCGVCGRVMTRSGTKHPRYYCSTPQVCAAYDCTDEKVPESDILNALLEGLHAQAAIAVEMSTVWEEQHRKAKRTTEAMLKKLSALKELYAQQERSIRELYEAFALGAINKAEYIAQKTDAAKKRDDTAVQISKLEASLENTDTNGSLQNRFVDSFKQYAEVKELTRDSIVDVLDTVFVYPEGRLEIVWNYRDDMKKLMLDLDR